MTDAEKAAYLKGREDMRKEAMATCQEYAQGFKPNSTTAKRSTTNFTATDMLTGEHNVAMDCAGRIARLS